MIKSSNRKKSRIALVFLFSGFFLVACSMALINVLTNEASSALPALRAAAVFLVLIALTYNLDKVTAFLSSKV